MKWNNLLKMYSFLALQIHARSKRLNAYLKLLKVSWMNRGKNLNIDIWYFYTILHF